MDFLIVSLLLFATFYYLYYLFQNLRQVRSTTNEKLDLPPGATGWPFIGETLDYLRTAKNGVPEKFIADRRNKYSSNVFKTSLLTEPMVLFCSAEGNKFLFSNENKLVKSWWPKNFELLFANSEKTTTSEESMRLRKVVSPFLKPDSLKSYIGIMDAETKKHMKTYWDHQEEVKVYPLAKKLTFQVACRVFLNTEDPEIIAKLEDPVRHISAGFISLPINLPGTKFNRAIKASKQIRKEIEKIVLQRSELSDCNYNNNQKEAAPFYMKDLLSHLLTETYSDGQLINETDIANKLYGLLIGAYDNISATMVSIISYLADLPQVYDRVRKEHLEILNSKAPRELLNWKDVQNMRYSWNVACEVMRLLPPNLGTFREVINDFMYEGYLIPKGFKVHWNMYATHKNPKYFPNPDHFDPSRFEGRGPAPFSFVPFGGGPRMCPGNEYARLKILVFMHNVVKNFKWEKVFPKEKIIMDPILIPTKGLPIRLYSHN